MKIIVAGIRNYDNYEFFEKTMNQHLKDYQDIELVSGGATGVDAYAEIYAKKYNLRIKVFPAEWSKYGNAAGPIRNGQMADYTGASGLLIAFWDYHSKGTGNMIRTAKRKNIRTIIIDVRKK